MTCFRDMTFCDSPACSCPPGRRLTDEVRAAAEKWWTSGGGEPGEAPIATGNICGGVVPEETSDEN